jgi:hypothetical protein
MGRLPPGIRRNPYPKEQKNYRHGEERNNDDHRQGIGQFAPNPWKEEGRALGF